MTQGEIRRQREVYLCALFFLVPFVLTMVAAAVHARPIWAAAAFGATVIGWIVWAVYFYRLSRCPACNRLLIYLFQSPPYPRCPNCRIPFTS